MSIKGKIEPIFLEKEMKTSYLSYAMSVIIGRALPDARDGLKPVQRRILYAMQELGLSSNKSYKKSARLVGEVLGKYHPHGDIAIYDAAVRMAQDFSLRYPLIDGQGNFGSIDGDPPAAMRYTEVKLASIAEEMLQDMDKETVNFLPNFDNSLKEPSILPAKIPNLLLNGASGIAVGMATNIPPHNLNELIDACIEMIKNPEISSEDLLKIVKGPDFPTGGIILGKKGIKKAYTEGKGKIVLRGKAEINQENKKENIIITEIPYQVNKAKLVERIAELSQENKIRGIKSLRDESDRKGIRVVLELLRGDNAQVVLNQLYKYTPLQTTFGINFLALVDEKPQLLNLSQGISCYLNHRKEVITRKAKFELTKEKKRAHILEGLRKALERLNEVIQIIKSSSTVKDAKEGLINLLEITPIQAEAILEMRLQRLTGLQRKKLEEDYLESLKKIKDLEEMLNNEEKIWGTIKEELLQIKEKYGDERRTLIEEREQPLILQPKDLIKKEDIIITLTLKGYIKSTPLKDYKRQGRGGKGASGIILGKRDFVKNLILANTHSTLLFFTNLGKVHWTMAYNIPQGKKSSKGRAVVNFLSLEEKEEVVTVIGIDNFNKEEFLLMVTKGGMIKKTYLSAYSHPQKRGIIAFRLKNEDELIKVIVSSGEEEVLLSTKKGKAILFSEKDIRPTGRACSGVKGISLKEDDEVKGAVIVEKDKALFTITSKGYGKRTLLNKYRKTRRGGKGIINMRLVPSKGEIAEIKKVGEEEEIMVITRKGKDILLRVKDVPLIGRRTVGARIIRLDKNDEVIAIT